jgi:hypothetical protein
LGKFDGVRGREVMVMRILPDNAWAKLIRTGHLLLPAQVAREEKGLICLTPILRAVSMEEVCEIIDRAVSVEKIVRIGRTQI